MGEVAAVVLKIVFCRKTHKLNHKNMKIFDT